MPAPNTAGCGRGSKLTAGMHALTSDGIERSDSVGLPANYDRNKAYPVIIGLHWRDGRASSSYKMAALLIHAKDDNMVPYSAGMEARDVFLKRDSCSANAMPVGSNGCVEYQGCDSGKPVLWCGTGIAGHWYPDFSAQESKAFFDRFK